MDPEDRDVEGGEEHEHTEVAGGAKRRKGKKNRKGGCGPCNQTTGGAKRKRSRSRSKSKGKRKRKRSKSKK